MPNNGELSSERTDLRKPPKVHRRQDETKMRRQTIAVPDDVAEALADRGTARNGRVVIQRELSMKLPPSSNEQKVESELEQAFSKFRRRKLQNSQSIQTKSSIEHGSNADAEPSNEAAARESVEKPAKPSNLPTSQKLTSANLQSDEERFSQPAAAWKSVSPVASDENATQKPSAMTTSQTFQSTDVHLASDTERSSLALAGNPSESHSSTSTQPNATCVENPVSAAETAKCSLSSSALRNSDKEVTKPAQSTGVFSVTQPAEKCTSIDDTLSATEPEHTSQSGLSTKTGSVSTNSEGTATNVPKQEHPKQTPMTTEAETAASSTTSKDDAQRRAARVELLARQKSCPEKNECQANSTAAPFLSRSLDAAGDGSANVRRPVEGLRSRAVWKTDESGNKLEIKLKKSHSITLKPRKNSTDASAGIKSAEPDQRQTATTVDDSCPSAHQDDSLLTAPVKEVSTESSDQLADETSVCLSEQTQVADNRASGIVQHIRLLKTREVIAQKRLSSVALTGSRCEDMPGEPIWFALARQKTQRWTEGKVWCEIFVTDCMGRSDQ